MNELKGFFRLLPLPQANSYRQLCEAIIQRVKKNETFRAPNSGKQNFIYIIDGRFVVKTAGFINQLHSKISSSGIDPIFKNFGILDINEKASYRNDIVKAATHCSAPCHQATSIIAYYLLMKKRLHGKKVLPVPSYPVQYGESTEFHDGNYVVIQPYLGNEYVTMDKVEVQELNQLIGPELLDDLADTVDAGAWNLNLPNLWIHKPLVSTDNNFSFLH